MATKIRASNLHTDVKTMVTTMVGENALDSAQANLLIDAKFTANNTDNLSEGSSNLYFTNARADARADTRAQLKIDALVDAAPGSLDTLNELAAALGDDANFSTTITNSVAAKLPLAGGTMTGDISHSSNLVLDAVGTITLDADTQAAVGGVIFKDGGTQFGSIYRNSGHLNIRVHGTSSKDIQLGNADGITALTLDMGLSGTAIFNNDIMLPDNGKAIFGAGSDLQIYHDGNNSFIKDAGAGRLSIVTSQLQLTNSADSQVMIKATESSAVELYYSGAEKLATTSTGIDVTGGVSAVGQITSARGSDTGTYGFRHEGAGKYMRMGVANASFAYFETDANGGFSFEGNVTVPNQILHAGDTDTYMQFNSVNSWRVVTGGSEKLAIGDSVVFNEDSNDVDFRVESNGNANMLFVDAGNDRVGIKNGSPLAPLDVKDQINVTNSDSGSMLGLKGTRFAYSTAYKVLQVGDDTGNYSVAIGYDPSGNPDSSFTGTGGEILFRHGAEFLVANNADTAFLPMYRMLENESVFNEDGNNIDFRVESENNPYAFFINAANDQIMFGDSSINSTQAQVGISLTTAAAPHIVIGNTQSSGNEYLTYYNRQNNDGGILQFRRGNATKGSVNVTTAGTTYNTTSDRRLKDNIQPISDATDKLMDMKPVTHTWIDNPEEPQVHGFIAQEMQEVVPEAVSGDAESDEMMSMDYGRITPVIVAALQDALKEIKELKTRIDELEAM